MTIPETLVGLGIRLALSAMRPSEAARLYGVRIDAAIGDPGMVIWFANRTSTPVRVRGWGIIERRKLGWLLRLPTVIAPENHRLNVDALQDRSADCQYPTHAVEVAQADDALLRCPGAPYPSYRSDSYVGWVDLAAAGIAFSAAKREGWSRSDIGTEVCDCKHHLILHASGRPVRLIGRRAHQTGECMVLGCRCPSFSRKRGLTLEKVPDAASQALKPRYVSDDADTEDAAH